MAPLLKAVSVSPDLLCIHNLPVNLKDWASVQCIGSAGISNLNGPLLVIEGIGWNVCTTESL